MYFSGLSFHQACFPAFIAYCQGDLIHLFSLKLVKKINNNDLCIPAFTGPYVAVCNDGLIPLDYP